VIQSSDIEGAKFRKLLRSQDVFYPNQITGSENRKEVETAERAYQEAAMDLVAHPYKQDENRKLQRAFREKLTVLGENVAKYYPIITSVNKTTELLKPEPIDKQKTRSAGSDFFDTQPELCANLRIPAKFASWQFLEGWGCNFVFNSKSLENYFEQISKLTKQEKMLSLAGLQNLIEKGTLVPEDSTSGNYYDTDSGLNNRVAAELENCFGFKQ